jgi:hypothetical protein
MANLLMAMFAGLMFESETHTPTHMASTAKAISHLMAHHILTDAAKPHAPPSGAITPQ